MALYSELLQFLFGVTAQDFLKLMGSASQKLRHALVLSDSLPNRYIILLSFISASDAAEFYQTFNGRPFNSFEPEICHIVCVDSIILHNQDTGDIYKVEIPEDTGIISIDPSVFIQKSGADYSKPLGLCLVDNSDSNLILSSSSDSNQVSENCQNETVNHSQGTQLNDSRNDCYNSRQNCSQENLLASESSDTLCLKFGSINVDISSHEFQTHKPSSNQFQTHNHVETVITNTINYKRSPQTQIGQIMSNYVELPTCPVCLDRMDSSVTGLLTTVCKHSFHCNCIVKWGDISCPVCRFNSTISINENNSKSANDELSQRTRCSEPGCLHSTENLWICLICANIGCGRYANKHAYSHYLATNHNYSLELETQRVWDYAGDGYVHRLIQSKNEGLVQLDAPAIPDSATVDRLAVGELVRGQVHQQRRLGLDTMEPTSLVSAQDVLVQEKVDCLGMEYANLLHAQLATQRKWFESKISQLELSSSEQISKLEMDLRLKFEQACSLESKLQSLQTAVQRLSQKLLTQSERMAKLQSDLDEESCLNKQLLLNQQFFKEQIEIRDKNIADLNRNCEELNDNCRDLMFFIETQSKISSGHQDVAGASVVGVSPPPASNSGACNSRSAGKKGKKNSGV